jgi:hypothetical protein
VRPSLRAQDARGNPVKTHRRNSMSDFENDNILNELKELKSQLESANEKFRNIEFALKRNGQSIEELLNCENQSTTLNLSYKNQLDLQEKKRINDNLSQQLRGLYEQFFNIQNGIVWFSMQVAAFHALLQKAAFYVAAERQVLEAKKNRDKYLIEKTRLEHLPKKTEEVLSIEEMAEKARTFPFHLNPYRTWPY